MPHRFSWPVTRGPLEPRKSRPGERSLAESYAALLSELLERLHGINATPDALQLAHGLAAWALVRAR
jgi:hypothetical protein